MGVTSEQDRNMNRFVVACALVACVSGAPSNIVGLGYAGHGQVVSAPVAHAPVAVGQTHHSYAAGPAVDENRAEYGVVGQRTVQTGHASVVAGHQYVVAGQEHIPQPAVSYAAGAPQNLVETRALPAPAIPAAPAPYAAIPPAPVPAGPAPADTVTQQVIKAPVRSHTRITPQVTNIIPEVQVHKYNVDVPVAVPRAVPREIQVAKHVAKPYEVHPVQEIVETPYVHHATVETHSTQAVVSAHATPVVTAHAAPVAAYAAAPAAVATHAVAAPAVAATYAAAPAVAATYAAAPAVAAHGYAVAAAPAVVA